MRVVAGSHRGRPLRAPKSAPTRPTADRVKEALFSMLEAEALKRGFELDDEGRMPSGLAWPKVLDLYAGSGALGIEALSRGAEHATFVEKSTDALKTLRANLQTLRFEEESSILQAGLPQALDRLRGTFDLVLLDAPYADDQGLSQTLERLGVLKLLAEHAVVAVELPAEALLPPAVASIPLRRSRQHGKTQVALYADSPPSD